MNNKQYKKIARTLKEAYRELELESLKAGIDVLSPEYDQLVAKVREAVLTKLGFTLDEYRQAKADDGSYSPREAADDLGKFKGKLTELDQRHIPTQEEIASIAHKVAKEYIKPPQIINKIVKEVVKEKPQIIKEVVKELDPKALDELKKDLQFLQESHVDLYKKVSETPEPDLEPLKEELRSEMDVSFKKNIDVMGMPDFRKLGMGLQAQIDELASAPAGSGSGDMLAATYDPTGVEADVFDVDNHVDGTTNKVYTATEKTKLAGIETAADVTDATNVDAAGAVMNTDTSTASMQFVIDEDAMTSNSATKVPTQQSVKAYVDAQAGGLSESLAIAYAVSL